MVDVIQVDEEQIRRALLQPGPGRFEGLVLVARMFHMARDAWLDKPPEAGPVVEEPVGGAHSDPEKMFVILKKVILEELKSFDNIPVDSLFEDRIEKYDNMGSYTYQE